MVYVFLFILGLCFGSFVNVLIYRLPFGKTILGRSMCDSCKAEIGWFDNIPVLSFLLLGGKCRKCNEKIYIQHPIVEASTAVLFVLSYYFLPFSIFVYFIFLVPILVAIFVIDIKHQIIPDELVFAGIIISTFFMLFFPATTPLFSSLLAGFAAALALLILHLITQGRGMGLGDVKFAILGGMMVGLDSLLSWLFIAFLTGAVVGVILIMTKKSKLKSKIAFGPFLVFALFVVILLGI